MLQAAVRKPDRVARDARARTLTGLLSLALIALVGGFLAGMLMLYVQRTLIRTLPGEQPAPESRYEGRASGPAQP